MTKLLDSWPLFKIPFLKTRGLKALEKFRNKTALNCIIEFNQKFNYSMLNFVYQIMNIPLILTP